MNKSFIFIFLCTCFCFKVKGQSLPNIIPPSPKAQNFNRFGSYPVTPNTGAPDISIPLYTIKSGKLEVPITLRYHIGAIKPGDDRSDIGFGWVLDVGGQISRTIMGNADDVTTKLASQYFNAQLDQTVWDNVQKLGSCLPREPLDSDYDIFNYSFLSQNGEFVIDKDPLGSYQAHLLSYKPLAFQFFTQPASNFSGHTLSTIKLTDPSGVLYTFGDGAVETCVGEEGSYGDAKTTWKLKQITAADQADEINFSYNSIAYNVSSYRAENVTSISMDDGRCFWSNSWSFDVLTANQEGYQASIDCVPSMGLLFYKEITIKEITFNEGKVVFELSADNKQIISFSIFDKQNVLVKKIAFYTSRFSTQGGHVRLDELRIFDNSLVSSQSYTFQYNNNPMGFSIDSWGYYNNGGEGCTARTYEYTDSYYFNNPYHHYPVPFGSSDKTPDPEAAQCEILKKIIFPTKGETEFIYEGNSYKEIIGTQINPGGGLRINSIIDRDGQGHEIIKSYKYEGGFIEHGVTNSFNYSENYTNTTYQVVGKQVVTCRAYAVFRNRYFKNSIHEELGDNQVKYTKVTEFYGEGSSNINSGKTTYYYQYSNPNIYGPYYSGIANDVGRTTLMARRDWDNGLLYKKDIFKRNANNSYEPVRQERNVYSFGSGESFHNLKLYRLTHYTHPLSLEGDYLELLSMDVSEGPPPEYKFFAVYNSYIYTGRTHLDKTVTTDYFTTGGVLDSVVREASHFYENPVHDQVTKTEVKTSKGSGDNMITLYKYPHDFAAQAPYDDMVNTKHIWSPVIEQITYKNSINSVPLQSTKTAYSYWNSNSNQVYPAEISSKQGNAPDPDSRITFNSYDNQGNVTSVSKTAGSNVCYLYSYGGRYPIAEIKNADYATVVAILGGSSAVETFRDNFSPTPTQVESFLGTLRGALPAAMITTYTYKPLVGITSMTDPREQKTTYEYDTFQRLQTIRDHNGKILKNYGYHYKP